MPLRLAWFSPMPPVRSGIATNSAELVAAMRDRYAIDVFVDAPAAGARSAHDFVWLHRRQPYDLTIYQLGNSSHHNFLWPYLFRFPGLAVLHDVHLHHARAALLLAEERGDQYRAEFAASHPGASPGLAELAAAGFDSFLYYMWPMTRLVVEASRAVAVHARAMADRLREDHPAAAIETIRLTQGVLVTADREARARTSIRARYGIPAAAPLVGCFGGLTPEKRIRQILDAFAAASAAAPGARLLLAGAPARHYDAAADAHARGLSDRVTIMGYIDSDDELTDAIAACDVVINLRWPTAREVSGPWLRALAAGKPTVTIDLAHLWDVPSLDPRTWTVNDAGIRGAGGPGGRDPGSGVRFSDDGRQSATRSPDPGSRIPVPGPRSPAPRPPAPITVAIDILDEDHSLRLALRRLATDAPLRSALGTAARQYWRAQHSPDASVEDYHRAIALAVDRPPPRPALPAHLTDSGERVLLRLLEPFGVTRPWSDGVHFDDSTQR